MCSSIKDFILVLLMYRCSQNGNCLYYLVSIQLKGNAFNSIELYEITKYYAQEPRLKDDHSLNQNIAFCTLQSDDGS